MSDAKTIVDKIGESFKKVTNLEEQAGDAQAYNPSNLRNVAVDALGLPPNWKINVADEKAFYKGLPEQMAQTAGSIGKVGSAASQIVSKIAPQAEAAAVKLEQAMTQGYKPVAAEMVALSKYRGLKSTVVPSYADAAAVAPLKQVKTMFNPQPSNSLGALESSKAGLSRKLKIGSGSGI